MVAVTIIIRVIFMILLAYLIDEDNDSRKCVSIVAIAGIVTWFAYFLINTFR